MSIQKIGQNMQNVKGPGQLKNSLFLRSPFRHTAVVANAEYSLASVIRWRSAANTRRRAQQTPPTAENKRDLWTIVKPVFHGGQNKDGKNIGHDADGIEEGAENAFREEQKRRIHLVHEATHDGRR